MNNAKAKILVVDDEKFYIDVLVELLNGDYQVVVAKEGEQALKRAEAAPLPDLILLDILMPGMDGYEVCRRLKENPHTRAMGFPENTYPEYPAKTVHQYSDLMIIFPVQMKSVSQR